MVKSNVEDFSLPATKIIVKHMLINIKSYKQKITFAKCLNRKTTPNVFDGYPSVNKIIYLKP